MEGGSVPRSLEIDGADFFYFDEGEASAGTVLLLHGFPDTPHSFGPLASELSKQGYRVVRPFLPGYAPAHWSGPFHTSSVANRILHFIERAALGPLHLVGHDWGAIVSYALLHQSPDLFLASSTISVPHPLFLANPRALGLAQARRSLYILLFQWHWLPEELARSRRLQLVSRLWKRWSPSYRLPPEALAQIEGCLVASASAPFAYYRNLFQSVFTRPKTFGEIEVPLLYVHGDEDGCIDSAHARGHEDYFRGGYQLAILPRVGHFVHAEAPLQLAQTLENWFRGPH